MGFTFKKPCEAKAVNTSNAIAPSESVTVIPVTPSDNCDKSDNYDLPAQIRWGHDITSIHDVALREMGYVLSSNPAGTFYVKRDSLMDPDCPKEIRQAWLNDKSQDRSKERAELLLRVKEVISGLRDATQCINAIHEEWGIGNNITYTVARAWIEWFPDGNYNDFRLLFKKANALFEPSYIPVDSKLFEQHTIHASTEAKKAQERREYEKNMPNAEEIELIKAGRLYGWRDRGAIEKMKARMNAGLDPSKPEHVKLMKTDADIQNIITFWKKMNKIS